MTFDQASGRDKGHPPGEPLIWCNICQRYVGNIDHLCRPRRHPDHLAWSDYLELNYE